MFMPLDLAFALVVPAVDKVYLIDTWSSSGRSHTLARPIMSQRKHEMLSLDLEPQS